MYSMYSKTSKHVGSFALGVYNSEEISTEKKGIYLLQKKGLFVRKCIICQKGEKNLEGFTYFPKEE